MPTLTCHEGLARLEKISADFDDSQSEKYAALVRRFINGMEIYLTSRGLPLTTPFNSIPASHGVDLPEDISGRLNAFLDGKKEYPPTVKKVCRWYLLELLAIELNLAQGDSSVYEPLIELLELGGDFYQHHGWICIRDAATVTIRRA
ncbi:hypothetical protein [Planctomicrobium sp. SH664]|uniref:hypothetical protein n=1 Tax=Planctomicrobium sp. SH664 TaxID=3448125 RepID=UPI003F5B3936